MLLLVVRGDVLHGRDDRAVGGPGEQPGDLPRLDLAFDLGRIGLTASAGPPASREDQGHCDPRDPSCVPHLGFLHRLSCCKHALPACGRGLGAKPDADVGEGRPTLGDEQAEPAAASVVHPAAHGDPVVQVGSEGRVVDEDSSRWLPCAMSAARSSATS